MLKITRADAVWVTLIILGIVSMFTGGNWESWLAASFVVTLLKHGHN